MYMHLLFAGPRMDLPLHGCRTSSHVCPGLILFVYQPFGLMLNFVSLCQAKPYVCKCQRRFKTADALEVRDWVRCLARVFGSGVRYVTGTRMVLRLRTMGPSEVESHRWRNVVQSVVVWVGIFLLLNPSFCRLTNGLVLSSLLAFDCGPVVAIIGCQIRAA